MLVSSRRSSGAMSTPSTTISPPAIGTSFMIALPSVDLPQPDSPTSPRVSPTARSRLTPLTARTTPAAVLKRTWTSCNASSDIALAPLGGEAGDQAARRRLGELGPLAPAALHHPLAARREGAALRQGVERRHHAGNVGQPLGTLGAGNRRRADQADRVGVQWVLEQLVDGGFLDLAAGIHHHDAVGGLGDHAEIV